MEIYKIILKNQIFSNEDLDLTTIKNFLNQEKAKGTKRKYPFSIFFEFSVQDIYQNKTLEEIYNYSIKNFNIFFSCLENEFSQKQIDIFALLFTLKNYNFKMENYKNGLEFIEKNYINQNSNIEIVKWCEEEIELFKLFLYSLDIENYKNGNISKELKKINEIIKNHENDLIFKGQENNEY